MNIKYIYILFLVLCFSSCSYILKPKQESLKIEDVKVALNKATEEDYQKIVNTASNSWFYGQGLGETALNIGTTVAFPPYAVFLLGNAILDLSGYQKLGVSTLLSDKSKNTWNKTYDEIVSVPGRITAAVGKEEYISNKEAEKRLLQIVKDINFRNTALVKNYSKESYLEAENNYWYN